ncbi:FxDxF family PEP-CTERM protein [Janthinobacterium fluminis]|uniref:FxDxF family PEP-CTERM protein n=1 Tax=Janthinobacterium fluminis TaxID=2987524 RepID=A0ABT5JUL6_9BURK|nr:FxDxF family PEP-CTERM protein [Janthinobacterium fluminis]MDC8756425.1 FxDxF family PEP-CTERM protein [Janthinobacterium fluminis]
MNVSFFAKAAGSALIAVSMFAGVSANAATTLVFNGESASFRATHGAGVTTFSDEYLFDVPALSSSDPFGTFTVSANRGGATIKNTNVTFFMINADNSRTALATVVDGTGFYLTSGKLGTGHYGFDFSGAIKDITKGGSYGGTLTMNVSAVPEPETYAMLLAGLGMLGFTARRKANNKVG